ncbi:unnamed protein product [Cunninghamella blakesleeana]
MANSTTSNKKGSSRLLGMKFMQRSLEKEQQEQLEKERKRIISEAEWKIDYEESEVQKQNIHVQYQPSFLSFTPVSQSGRQSYQKFNKKVEKSNNDEQNNNNDDTNDSESTQQKSDEELLKNMRRKRVNDEQNGSSKKKKTDKKDKHDKKKERTFIKPE